MKQLSSSQIRQMYLDFFKSKGHDVKQSAPLVPKDDPTLLWINSGVATMKKYFDGSVVPKNHRMTSSQKSIRTNDIENVGHTARHHTFFEMLGNFSIGDYFKKEAITWAWELLTSPKWYGINPDRLYVTVYPKDTETKRIWKDIVGVKESHIYEDEDNFWDIGEGPSGPDSEIFFDRGQKFSDLKEDDPNNYPGGENSRYLEIWNIVFSEFNHKPDGTYEPLPHKNIDTGMGLERVVSVFQEAKTNFETDLFMPIINKVEKMTENKKYGVNKEDDIAFKVIADHVRAVSFAIGDGALPSNEGRGYVIRRLIRRAVMYGQQLGIKKAFLYKLVPIVGEIMKTAYPEILEQQDYISKVIKQEEDRFQVTLRDGVELLDNLIAEIKKQDKDILQGKDVFKLYDTYGFPYELTQEYAAAANLKVDRVGFESEMEKQKQRARSARSNEKSMGVQNGLLTDIKTPSEFVGYSQLETKSNLTEIINENDLVDKVLKGSVVQVIFDKTPFYAEMGGQVSDKGFIYSLTGEKVAEVLDVQHAPNGQNLHKIKALSNLEKKKEYILKVNQEFRSKVSKNHTATHLLDQALRDVLGTHTHQAGSLVEPTYLRFDFTNLEATSPEKLDKIEKIVNEKIWDNLQVKTIQTDIKSATEMGAIALFTDKYGEEVRVVRVGDYSSELCGGTHVENTNEIGLFKIVSESGIGAGIRRIEAVTSKEAYEFLNSQSKLLKESAHQLKTSQIKEVPKKIEQVQETLRILVQQKENLEAKFANQQALKAFKKVEQIGKYNLISEKINVSNVKQLRSLADQWKEKNLSDVLILATVIEDKVNLLVAVSKNANTKGIKAGNIVKEISDQIDGAGGGRDDLAQAGGKKASGVQEAFKKAKKYLENN